MKKLYYKNRLLIALSKPIENRRLFTPLKLSILTLKDYGYWPEHLVALDAFCQTGLQWTRIYGDEAAYLEMWDVDPLAVSYAKKTFPSAVLVCGDSVKAFKNKGFRRSDYNFVMIDTPAPFRYPDGSFEHFDFFDGIFENLANDAVIIFNVVPYIRRMLDRHPNSPEFELAWSQARAGFYGQVSGEVILPSVMEKVYPLIAARKGYDTRMITYNARNAFFGFITMVVRKQ